jgi:N-acetylmuramoyl-L-alanine amidase
MYLCASEGVRLGILIAAALLMLLAPACAARSHARPRLSDWDQAVQLRQQLEDSPPAQRSRERYEQVLDAFRVVYHKNPQGAKAPAAAAAVADLLAEKGRVLGDQHALHAAIGQYEFLRKQYPQSPQVANAMLLEAEICRQDLKDVACAEEKFHAVLDESPNTSFAEQAAMELKGLEPPSPVSKKGTSKGTRSARANGRINSGHVNNGRIDPAAHSAQEADERAAASHTKENLADTTAQSTARSAATPDDAPASMTPASTTPAPMTPVSTQSLAAAQPERAPQGIVTITGMRHWSNPTSTRIAIDLGGKVEYEAARVPNPERIFFDLHGAKLARGLNGHQVEVVDDGYLKRIRAAQFRPDVTRVVLDVTDVSQYSAFLLPNPWRLIIDIHGAKADGAPNTASVEPQAPATHAISDNNTIADVAGLSSEPAKVPATAGPTSGPVSAKVPASEENSESATAPAAVRSRKKTRAASENAEAEALPHAADPASDGQRSLVRALGLKVGRIVIDAGHGGHDSGTLGPGGIEEKDVVLDVALRVGKLLHQRLGAEIVYTRSDDTFIPLETRTAIANKAQADLFLSIHANSSPEPEARGVETYYLNFTSDPGALDVAARENAVSSHSVHQLSDLVRKIALKDKIDESREFAADVDAGLYAGLKKGNPGMKDRGVKKAPFVVLIGAQMPSILAEISFLTNPEDAEKLQEGSYRQRIAESLDAGVERYLHGLSGARPSEKAKSSVKVAAKDDDETSGR